MFTKNRVFEKYIYTYTRILLESNAVYLIYNDSVHHPFFPYFQYNFHVFVNLQGNNPLEKFSHLYIIFTRSILSKTSL